MAIPSKSSRKIVVENEIYKWIISVGDKSLVFVAEHDEYKGRRLEVHIKDFNTKSVTPKDAATFIIEAIEKGWNPKEKGSPFVVSK